MIGKFPKVGPRVYGGGGLDPDASAFIAAAGITDATQQSAINTLVVGLKAQSLWAKMKAVYPFVGGSATSHKFNLKDPRDLDAAFRLQFFGGWTHSANGATPNGTNAYADMFINPSTNLIIHDFSVGYYSRTTTSAITELLGSWNSALQQIQFVTNDPSGQLYLDSYAASVTSGRVTASIPSFTGLLSASRDNINSATLYRNAVAINTNNTNPSGGSVPTPNMFLAALNVNGSALLPTNLDCAFAFVADGLNSTLMSNLYTLVQAFQTSLNRQVS